MSHQGLVAAIEKKLSKYYLESQHSILKSVQVLDFVERPYSSILFLCATTNRSEEKLVLKKINSDNEMNLMLTRNQKQSIVEYDILNKLYPEFKKIEGCNVPCPVLVDPELDIVITKFVEGKILTEELHNLRYFSSSLAFKKIDQIFFRLGRWLKVFQEIAGDMEADISTFNNTIDRCEMQLGIIQNKAGNLIPKDLRKIVMDQISTKISELKNENITVSGRHSDFGHWNVLLNGDKLTVIDFLGFDYEPRCVDLLKMLTFFRTCKYNFAKSRHRISRLKNSFLKGYGVIAPVPKAIIEFYETHQRIHNLCGSLMNKGYNVVDRLARKYMIKDDIKWLMDERHKDYLWPDSKILY